MSELRITDSLVADNVLSTNKTDIENRKVFHGVVARPVVGNPLPTFITTATFTLSALTYPVTYYYQGTKVIVNTNQTTVLSGAAGLYFIYFNAALGTLLNSNTFPGIDTSSNVIIATVTWNGTDYGLVNDERHAYTRCTDWHTWAHTTVGCRYGNGITLTHNGGTGAAATLATTVGTIYDEDINFIVNAGTTCRLWWQTGVSTYTFDKTASAVPFKLGTGNRPIYINSTSAYAITTLNSATNRYVNYFVYATTDLSVPIYIFAETQTAALMANGYTSVANARAIPFPNLSALGMNPEFKAIYRLIIRADGQVQAIDTVQDDYRLVTSLPQAAGVSTPYINKDGWFDYNHSGTTQSYTTGNLQVLNDGAGVYTRSDFKPINTTNLFNITTGEFSFSELAIGDEVYLRTDGIVTTSANNQKFGTFITFDIGGTPYNLQVGQTYEKTAGAYSIIRNIQFYIGSTGMRDNPGRLYFYSDASATIQLNGFYISVKKRT